jgi:hypothetical protein
MIARFRAAWFAFRNPDALVHVKPGLIQIHAPITKDVALAIKRELLALKRQQGGAPLGLS